MGNKPKVATMDVPSSFGNQERRFAESVKENVDVLTGQRGESIDRAITFRDLIDAGVIKLKDGFFTGLDNVPSVETAPPLLDVDIPPAPANLTATGAFRVIVLSWTQVKYKGHDRFEIFRNTSNSISSATFFSSTPGYTNIYADDVGTTDGIGKTYYYWVRAVNLNNVAGPFNATSGVQGQTQTDVNILLDTLEGEVLSSTLNTALQSTINKIDPTEAVVTNLKDMYTVKIQATTALNVSGLPTTGALSATAGSSTITCTHGSTATVAVGDIVQIASASSLGGAITASILNDKHIVTTRTNTTFTFTAENGTAAVLATSSDAGNGGSISLSFFAPYISGFGLSNTLDLSGNPTSAFIVNADKFAVVSPTNSSRITGTEVSKMPFYVTSSPSTDSTTGISIPAGVYIRDAFIAKANILNLLAGNVAADAIRSGVVASATSILTPSINMGSLNAPNADQPWNWSVSNSSTRYTNFSVSTSGEMHANYGRLRGMDIRAADDTVLLRSGGAQQGTGGSLINNGDFVGELVVSTAADGTVSQTMTYGIGWTATGSATFANGQVTLGASAHIDSEMFPVSGGETLYVEVYGSGITAGTDFSVLIIGYDSSKTWLSGAGNATASASSYSVDSNVASAAITMPVNTSLAYGKLRLTSTASKIYYNVYVGKSPRRIAPEYASTYIRNATVDTLQIAGEAATIPLSLASGQYGYQDNTTEVVISTTLGANFGTNIPTKVVCLAGIKIGSSGTGSDFASAIITLRYNTSDSTAISGSTIVQQIGQHGRKGAPPYLFTHDTISGWSGARYFFLTLTVTGDGQTATGWWRSDASNITLFGSRR
ncbi:MAG: hypothetical protein CL504_06765 [Actinobacteria bacterium]|nr:hypothetical protein [Actinomycetota bacterium]